MTESVNIVAEIGSNYDSDLGTAKKYILASKNSGADIVKFQTLRKEKLIAPMVCKGNKWEKHPAWENFSNLELPDEWHFILKEFADECNIEFISTPFYLEAIDLLEKVKVSRYKIASGDVTFFPLLEKVGETGKPVILSTGRCPKGNRDTKPLWGRPNHSSSLCCKLSATVQRNESSCD